MRNHTQEHLFREVKHACLQLYGWKVSPWEDCQVVASACSLRSPQTGLPSLVRMLGVTMQEVSRLSPVVSRTIHRPPARPSGHAGQPPSHAHPCKQMHGSLVLLCCCLAVEYHYRRLKRCQKTLQCNGIQMAVERCGPTIKPQRFSQMNKIDDKR